MLPYSDINACRNYIRAIFIVLFSLASIQIQAQDLVQIEGELKEWHRLSVLVECPESACGVISQNNDPNPFTTYRLLVSFTSPDGEEVFDVPGYYAGDGRAEISESDSGNVWIAHFAPHQTGTWQFAVSFQTGPDIVLHREAGTPVPPDGFSGSFTVNTSDKSGKDFRVKGFLKHVNSNYYYFSGTNTPFLKNGAGSPENLLNYHEIDNTYQHDTIPVIPSHEFVPHLDDFNEGDPLWGPSKSKGKGIIGALNYLGTLDINSYYFIVNNTSLDDRGQGTGVWPWASPDTSTRDRFSVAKLAQWEVIFSHMDSLGISMNLVTQDRINQDDLDGGDLGRIRKIYYRELVARYGHHLGLIWNLGEENSATTEQIKDYANFIRSWDVYEHPIVSQANGTLDAHERYYEPLVGFPNFHGASLQVGLNDLNSNEPPSPPGKIHDAVLKWVQESKAAGTPWVVMLDEIGHWRDGIVPDGDPRDSTNRRARREGFWGTLMAGGAGADWYYGASPFKDNDIWAEDFTKRAEFFQRTRNGINMILDNDLPFWEMENQNAVSSRTDTWVLGKEGDSYLVYTPFIASFLLDLPDGEYDVRWYDAFDGGDLQEGTITEVTITSDVTWTSIGKPIDFAEDAVAVVTVKPDLTSNEADLPEHGQKSVLKQSYPNPFRTTTTIEFEIAGPNHVELNIFDTLGRNVRAIENKFMPKGSYSYTLDLSDLTAGLYFYRLTVGDREKLESAIVRLR